MRRSRAPGTLLAACLWLSLAGWLPAVPPDGEAPGAPEGTTTLATTATQPAGRDVHRTNGFVCERRTVTFRAASTSYMAQGKVVLGKQDCYECCQEYGLFSDGFESGDTGAWSSTLPKAGDGAEPQPDDSVTGGSGDGLEFQQATRREPCAINNSD